MQHTMTELGRMRVNMVRRLKKGVLDCMAYEMNAVKVMGGS